MEEIKSLLDRGVEQVLPVKQSLMERLNKKPFRLYHGIDPTAPTLHLGHLSTLLKVKDFQVAGCEVIILFGGFTATIGDPTDKLAARSVLSLEQVEANMRDYKNLILKILDPKKTTFRNNREWFERMPLIDFIDLTTKVTIQESLKRDMFRRRQENGQEIYVNEFLYPILQGYDSVALDVDLEIGGNDQLFNMLVGRDLAKKLTNKEKFVLTTKLLVDSTGKKMGKTEGNMAALTDEPGEIFGKIMSWPDTLMPTAFEILTRLPLEQVEELLAGHPKIAKLTLAEEVVKIIYSEAEARGAREGFEKTFKAGEMPDNIRTITAVRSSNLGEVLTLEQVVKSKSDFRRLVEQKGVEVNGEKISDPNFILESEVDIRIGAHRFIKIKVE